MSSTIYSNQFGNLHPIERRTVNTNRDPIVKPILYQESTPMIYHPVHGTKLRTAVSMDVKWWRSMKPIVWLYDPWTGLMRTTDAIYNDPHGMKIEPRGENFAFLIGRDLVLRGTEEAISALRKAFDVKRKRIKELKQNGTASTSFIVDKSYTVHGTEEAIQRLDEIMPMFGGPVVTVGHNDTGDISFIADPKHIDLISHSIKNFGKDYKPFYFYHNGLQWSIKGSEADLLQLQDALGVECSFQFSRSQIKGVKLRGNQYDLADLQQYVISYNAMQDMLSKPLEITVGATIHKVYGEPYALDAVRSRFAQHEVMYAVSMNETVSFTPKDAENDKKLGAILQSYSNTIRNYPKHFDFFDNDYHIRFLASEDSIAEFKRMNTTLVQERTKRIALEKLVNQDTLANTERLLAETVVTANAKLAELERANKQVEAFNKLSQTCYLNIPNQPTVFADPKELTKLSKYLEHCHKIGVDYQNALNKMSEDADMMIGLRNRIAEAEHELSEMKNAQEDRQYMLKHLLTLADGRQVSFYSSNETYENIKRQAFLTDDQMRELRDFRAKAAPAPIEGYTTEGLMDEIYRRLRER